MWDEFSVSGNKCILAQRMIFVKKVRVDNKVPKAEIKSGTNWANALLSPRVNFTSQKRNHVFVNTSIDSPLRVYGWYHSIKQKHVNQIMFYLNLFFED